MLPSFTPEIYLFRPNCEASFCYFLKFARLSQLPKKSRTFRALQRDTAVSAGHLRDSLQRNPPRWHRGGHQGDGSIRFWHDLWRLEGALGLV